MQTKTGNIKSPNALQVSQWTSEWAKSQQAASISKAFDLCGIVHPNKFKLKNLHDPLQRCFGDDFDNEAWMDQFGSIIAADENCGWEFPAQKKFSLFNVIYQYIETSLNLSDWCQKFLVEVIRNIDSDLFDQEDENRLTQGMATESFAEFPVISRLLKAKITLCELDQSYNTIQKTFFGSQEEKILIALLDGKFGTNNDDICDE